LHEKHEWFLANNVATCYGHHATVAACIIGASYVSCFEFLISNIRAHFVAVDSVDSTPSNNCFFLHSRHQETNINDDNIKEDRNSIKATPGIVTSKDNVIMSSKKKAISP